MNDNNYGNTECLAGPQGHNSCSTFGFKPLTPRACIHDIFQELRTSFELSGLKSEIGLCVRVLPQRSTIRSNLLVSGSLLRRMCGYYRPLYLIYWAPSPIIRWFDIHTFFWNITKDKRQGEKEAREVKGASLVSSPSEGCGACLLYSPLRA